MNSREANEAVACARSAAAEVHRRIATLGTTELDLLFREARSHNGWTDRPVTDDLIRSIYELTKMGPTCANSCPARFLFLKSNKAKEKLAKAVAKGNASKVLTAPLVAIIGYELEFHRDLPRLFPHNPAMHLRYSKDPSLAETTAFRNSTLQGAYLMLAARSLGLDCGPMSGFDNKAVDRIFFDGKSVKSNFICALGYGDVDKLFQRLPRFEFSEVCRTI